MAISTVLWLACAPALTASFAALVVAACVLHAKTGATAALVASAVLVLLLRFRLADAGARARILSGHSPFGCFAAPKTVEAFVDRLCAVWHATDGRPAVVGSGWGWFIGRARAPNAVFTHNLQGRIGKLAFLAGTELRTVEATLRKQYGRTFWSTPTMQRISIGSWLARSCHGNSGAAGKPSQLRGVARARRRPRLARDDEGGRALGGVRRDEAALRQRAGPLRRRGGGV